MYLVIIAAFVLAYSSRELPLPAGFDPYITLRATLLLTAIVTLVGSILPVVVHHNRRLPHLRNLFLRRLMWFHLGFPLGVFAFELIGLGWQRVVADFFNLRNAILLDDVLVMAPFLVPLFASLLGLYWLDVALRGAVWSLRGYLTYNIRKLMLPMVLWFGFMAVLDAVERTDLPMDFGSRYPILYWLCGAGVITLTALFLPFVIRILWGLKPLPSGPLRRELEALVGRVGLTYRDILVLPTYGGVVNAGVTGLSGSFRYIILTDALMKCLTQEELEVVFHHELAHVKHRHIPFYLLLSVGFVALAVAYWSLLPDQSGLLGWAQVAGFLIGAGAYWGLLFGMISRRFERQADLYAAKATSPETISRALEKIASFGSGRRLWSWRHSSVSDRVEFVMRTARDPAEEVRFEASIRRTYRMGYGLVAVGITALIVAAILVKTILTP